jgi:hypothetical protein
LRPGVGTSSSVLRRYRKRWESISFGMQFGSFPSLNLNRSHSSSTLVERTLCHALHSGGMVFKPRPRCQAVVAFKEGVAEDGPWPSLARLSSRIGIFRDCCLYLNRYRKKKGKDPGRFLYCRGTTGPHRLVHFRVRFGHGRVISAVAFYDISHRKETEL